MTLTPNQREELRTLQQRFDDEAALKRAEAANARQITVTRIGTKQGMWYDFAKRKWIPYRKPESRVQRWLRKFFDWLDGGIE